MRTFTPGPWTVCSEHVNDYWHIGLTIGSAAPGDARRICDLANFDPPMREANGRLICAAPDLLACQTMGAEVNTPDFLDWIADRLVNVYQERPEVDYVLSLRERAKAGRAAISKALRP